MFDWIAFLEQYGITYATSGRNVSRGDVGVNCPFCSEMGDPDPSDHMGISLSGKGWKCWRHSEHSGRSPTKLVQALLRCTYARAAEIVGEDSALLPTDISKEIETLLNGAPPKKQAAPLSIPSEFRPLSTTRWSAEPYVKYLRDRDFSDKVIDRMTKDYGMFYATQGPYKGRVIFTVYQDDRLVSWVGRTIYKTDTVPRYLALTTTPEKAEVAGSPLSENKITDYLLWYDRIIRNPARAIVLVEGPFDALKLSVIGKQYGIQATCFFTSAYSSAQRGLLAELLPKFEKRFVMLDPGPVTMPKVLSMIEDLRYFDVQPIWLPDGIEDPGELRKSDLSGIGLLTPAFA